MGNTVRPPSQRQLEAMHALYRRGGMDRLADPHVIYQPSHCPHPDCCHSFRAIDFRLEDFGRVIHDPLVRAWWNDTGFAGKCPTCGGWIHFTIRGKRAIGAEEAAALPCLPDEWHKTAVIL